MNALKIETVLKSKKKTYPIMTKTQKKTKTNSIISTIWNVLSKKKFLKAKKIFWKLVKHSLISFNSKVPSKGGQGRANFYLCKTLSHKSPSHCREAYCHFKYRRWSLSWNHGAGLSENSEKACFAGSLSAMIGQYFCVFNPHTA